MKQQRAYYGTTFFQQYMTDHILSQIQKEEGTPLNKEEQAAPNAAEPPTDVGASQIPLTQAENEEQDDDIAPELQNIAQEFLQQLDEQQQNIGDVSQDNPYAVGRIQAEANQLRDELAELRLQLSTLQDHVQGITQQTKDLTEGKEIIEHTINNLIQNSETKLKQMKYEYEAGETQLNRLRGQSQQLQATIRQQQAQKTQLEQDLQQIHKKYHHAMVNEQANLQNIITMHVESIRAAQQYRAEEILRTALDQANARMEQEYHSKTRSHHTQLMKKYKQTSRAQYDQMKRRMANKYEELEQGAQALIDQVVLTTTQEIQTSAKQVAQTELQAFTRDIEHHRTQWTQWKQQQRDNEDGWNWETSEHKNWETSETPNTTSDQDTEREMLATSSQLSSNPTKQKMDKARAGHTKANLAKLRRDEQIYFALPPQPTQEQMEASYNTLVAAMSIYDLPITPLEDLTPTSGTTCPHHTDQLPDTIKAISNGLYMKLQHCIPKECKVLQDVLTQHGNTQDGYRAIYQMLVLTCNNLRLIPDQWGPTWPTDKTPHEYATMLETHTRHEAKKGRRYTEVEIASEMIQQAMHFPQYHTLGNSFLAQIMGLATTEGRLPPRFSLPELAVTFEQYKQPHSLQPVAPVINKVTNHSRTGEYKRKPIQCTSCHKFGHTVGDQMCHFSAQLYHANRWTQEYPDKAKSNAEAFSKANAPRTVTKLEAAFPDHFPPHMTDEEREQRRDEISDTFFQATSNDE